jgi:molybdenum cofactor cytidylyltransferase
MITPGELGAIILAAGRSSRMGGPNKLLTPVKGRPLLEHAIATVASLVLGDAVIVTGHMADEAAMLASPWRIRTVHNPRFADGMGTSIAAGMAALKPSLAGVFVVLGDMPFIEARDYAALAASFSPATGGDICVTVHGGRRGHPVLFGRHYFSGLSRLDGDRGAAALVQNHGAFVVEVPVDSPRIFTDFDEPGDFSR